MKSLLVLGSMLFSLAAHASLKFEDTTVKFAENFKFAPLASANSFAYQGSKLQISVSRTAPQIPVNERTVNKLWKQNLEVASVKATQASCVAQTRFHYICSHTDKNQKIYLSYSRKDIVAVVVSSKIPDSTKVDFELVKK